MGFFRFLLWSLVIHAVLAGGLAWYLAYAPRPTVVATLDLSSVELSIAEEEHESAPTIVARGGATGGAPRKALPVPLLETPLGDGEVAVPPLPPEPEIAEVDVVEKMEEGECVNAAPETGGDTVAESEAGGGTVAAPRQARVDAPPKPMRTIRPDYPRSARQRGEQGDVVLEISVAADGSVSSVAVATSSGFADLDAAALKAVGSARFTPAKSGDEPVASTARLTLTFKLK